MAKIQTDTMKYLHIFHEGREGYLSDYESGKGSAKGWLNKWLIKFDNPITQEDSKQTNIETAKDSLAMIEG